MLTQRVYFTEDKRAYIDCYIADIKNLCRDAMLVIPGGGYLNVCHEREGEPIALAYLAKGYNAFVLNYRVGNPADTYPTQLLDACRAVLHIKENAEKYNIDPNRVFAVGFSAGGHLAGSLALMTDDKLVLDTLGVTKDMLAIKGAVLAYPVVTALMNTHRASFERLSGYGFDDIPKEQKEKYSLETHVKEGATPLFIWHTAEDKAVPPCGSLALAQKCVESYVPVSFHIYPYGCHGSALADKFTNYSSEAIQPLAQNWLNESVDFLNSIN